MENLEVVNEVVETGAEVAEQAAKMDKKVLLTVGLGAIGIALVYPVFKLAKKGVTNLKAKKEAKVVTVEETTKEA